MMNLNGCYRIPTGDKDFLDFVAENDGRNFKQGSRMQEVGHIVTPDVLAGVIRNFEQRIEALDKRICSLEKHNSDIQAEKDGWQKDEWGEFRLPPPMK